MGWTLAQTIYLDSRFDVPQDLPRAGTTLEHPLVFDATARELMQMESSGKVEIIEKGTRVVGDDTLIDHLRFKRLR